MCFVYYKAEAMAHCAPLLKLLAAVAPNTALPIRKLELALSKERPSTLGAVVGGRVRHLDEEWLCTCLDLNGGDASMSLGFLIVPMEGWIESSGETCLRERDMFLHNSYSIKESETLIHNMSNIHVCIVKLIKPMCKYQQCFYLIGSQYIIS